jgi:acetate CoA/acetoacetate CoA-transferase alpha subunit
MKNKTNSIEQMIRRIPDNSSIMLGGFGSSGSPFSLMDELMNQGQTGLTLIKNDTNETGIGIYKMVKKGQVKKIIATHIGLNPLVMEMAESGELDVELCPQGIMAERIRCRGVGVKGFVSDIGLGTEYADSREKVVVNNGETCLFEPALGADFALIHAQTADTFGNMQFNTAGINFSPIMAMAADVTLLETKTLVAVGNIPPAQVHLSGVVVDELTCIPYLTGDYDPIKR